MRRRITWRLIRLADRLTQLIYRASGGRLGASQLGYSILLLETVGRKTGKWRIHALLYMRDGENLVVCASSYGLPRHPAWYLNLCAKPGVVAQVGRERGRYLAETASGTERERLWRDFVRMRPATARYQTATSRLFPMVVLQPVPPSGTETC